MHMLTRATVLQSVYTPSPGGYGLAEDDRCITISFDSGMLNLALPASRHARLRTDKACLLEGML
jgi:hypothetical protein